jgi:hypothetical protein
MTLDQQLYEYRYKKDKLVKTRNKGQKVINSLLKKE